MAKPNRQNGQRATLEERRDAVQRHERAVAQVEAEHARAETEVADIEARLKEMGFDPKKDLEPQIARKEAELDDLLGTTDGIIRDLQERLA